MLLLSAVAVHYQVLLCSDSYYTMLLLQTSYVSYTSGGFSSGTYLPVSSRVIRAFLNNGVLLRNVC